MDIDKNTIETILKIKDTPFPDISDDEFEIVKNYFLNNILNELNISLEPVEHSEVNLYTDLNKKQYLLGFYPVNEIKKITITTFNDINYNLILNKDYWLDSSSGVIRFKTRYPDGKITIEYISCLPNNIKTQIQSILIDLLVNNFKSKGENDISSMHEGDLTISYDTSNSTTKSIQNKIQKLKTQLTSKAIMI